MSQLNLSSKFKVFNGEPTSNVVLLIPPEHISENHYLHEIWIDDVLTQHTFIGIDSDGWHQFEIMNGIVPRLGSSIMFDEYPKCAGSARLSNMEVGCTNEDLHDHSFRALVRRLPTKKQQGTSWHSTNDAGPG